MQRLGGKRVILLSEARSKNDLLALLNPAGKISVNGEK